MLKNKLSMMSKKSKMIAATAFVLGLSVIGTSAFAAADTTKTDHMNSIVSAIATKFNLSTTEVQTVVDSVMTAQRAEMEAKHKEESKARLTEAVTAGKITQTQADLISAKETEMRASMESNRDADKNLTQEERKTKMEARKTELENWATSNGISTEYLHFLGGAGKGFRGPDGQSRDNQNPPSEKTTTTNQN